MSKKEKILERIVGSLSKDFDILFHAAKKAHEAATHAENIPDNKYDTLSLEASYVAQGQANRAQEIKSALETYKSLRLHSFDDASAIRLTALVTLEDEEGNARVVFLGPSAGGLKIEEEGEEITVITPQSPLGRQLLGKHAGDVVEIATGGSMKEYEIAQIV